jgi:hypothetical protein
MKVIATKMGFYKGHRIREGREFSLQDPKHLNTKWMEPSEKAAPAEKKAKAAPAPTALSEMQNIKSETFNEVVSKKSAE